MKKCKMMCLDLDGTLLNDDKKISKKDKDAVYAAKEAGIEIVIATGRQYRKAIKFIKDLGFPVTVVANNGSTIRDSFNDKRLYFSPMKLSLSRELLEIGDRFDRYPLIHVDCYDEGFDIVAPSKLPNYITERYGTKGSKWMKVLEHIDDDLLSQATTMIYLGSRYEIIDWHNIIKKELKSDSTMHFLENLQSFESMLEIMDVSGTKWDGIIHYANNKGINCNEIFAIGDDNNDLQMLEGAGISFAPANAALMVKDTADYLLNEDNNQSAVSVAINMILK